MAKNWRDKKPNCFIEFRINDKQRFEILQRFFEPLRDWTQRQPSAAVMAATTEGDSTLPSIASAISAADTQEHRAVSATEETVKRTQFANPQEWLLALRPQDMEFLGLPLHPEAIAAMRSWEGLSRRERRKAIKAHDNPEKLRQLADFADMLRHWDSVQYVLVSCDMAGTDNARITYSTFDFPFEGKIALEELLLFFGFPSIINDSC